MVALRPTKPFIMPTTLPRSSGKLRRQVVMAVTSYQQAPWPAEQQRHTTNRSSGNYRKKKGEKTPGNRAGGECPWSSGKLRKLRRQVVVGGRQASRLRGLRSSRLDKCRLRSPNQHAEWAETCGTGTCHCIVVIRGQRCILMHVYALCITISCAMT